MLDQTPCDDCDGVGLTSAAARARLAEYGPNELVRRPVSRLELLARQAHGTIFWLLVSAALLSAALGDTIEAAAMAAIIALNAFVAFAQELHSEQALRQLHAAGEPRATLRRDGRSLRVRASEVVPGDILVLAPGDIVAADGVIRVAHELAIDEAELTGEVTPAPKHVNDGTATARDARVFKGTIVVAGRGSAEVTATGARTELGSVARLAPSAPRVTPLERQLDRVGTALIAACLAIVLVVATLELIHGGELGHVLLSSISLAVASLPESLSAIVTVVLTSAARALFANHVVVRRLDAVETLGRSTLLCAGKSGTLTASEIAVRELHATDTRELIRAALASTTDESLTTDPIARAIASAAQAAGIAAPEPVLRSEMDGRDRVEPYVAVQRGETCYMRGAPDALLPRCRELETTDPLRALPGVANAMQARGLLVLAIARGPVPGEPRTCVGLLGLSERLRPRTKDTVEILRGAGVHIVMMTGDHEREARVVAQELGLIRAGATSDSNTLMAELTPEQKVQQVLRWKDAGEIVAVTGDRINDAQAMRAADIAIAMGDSGSDVTRDAADMILRDDDLSHLIGAVELGRAAYQNIQKSLVYILAGNLAELLIMLFTSALGWPEPLLPFQLVWINLVTDSLPALALVLDPPDAGILERAPRRADEAMLGAKQWTTIVSVGILQTALALLAFRLVSAGGQVARARALCLSIVVFAELSWALALSIGSHRRRRPTNGTLLLVLIGSALLECALELIPMNNSLGSNLHLAPLDILLGLLLGAAPLAATRLYAYVSDRFAVA